MPKRGGKVEGSKRKKTEATLPPQEEEVKSPDRPVDSGMRRQLDPQSKAPVSSA